MQLYVVYVLLGKETHSRHMHNKIDSKWGTDVNIYVFPTHILIVSHSTQSSVFPAEESPSSIAPAQVPLGACQARYVIV